MRLLTCEMGNTERGLRRLIPLDSLMCYRSLPFCALVRSFTGAGRSHASYLLLETL